MLSLIGVERDVVWTGQGWRLVVDDGDACGQFDECVDEVSADESCPACYADHGVAEVGAEAFGLLIGEPGHVGGLYERKVLGSPHCLLGIIDSVASCSIWVYGCLITGIHHRKRRGMRKHRGS